MKWLLIWTGAVVGMTAGMGVAWVRVGGGWFLAGFLVEVALSLVCLSLVYRVTRGRP